MGETIGIFNFDQVYQQQDFYVDEKYEWIECSDLSGVNGYCDERSRDILRKRIRDNLTAKINFIDSGNYHYVTYLLLEQIKEDFTLVLFDHHTDMQPSLFSEILSCGSWVKWAIDENQHLKEVIIIGAKEELLREIKPAYRSHVFAYSEETVDAHTAWEQFAADHVHYPVYMSVDKDVIDDKEARTNWDQGVLSLEQLKQVYHIIHNKHQILGIDVCGECDINNSFVAKQSFENELNNKANREILELVED